ncbi:MAG: hypothetical protein ACRDMV_13155 [Streptosporangiales bacterium]
MLVAADPTFAFPESAFAPVVLGFFGLGTGYLIYGPQELFHKPERNADVDRSTGVWGIWMPGFCQLLTGVYLFVGMTWFQVFKDPLLYMAALAFSAYGIHWFAIGWNRLQATDARPNGHMAIPFTIISILGMVVFFAAGAWPVGVLFAGLTAVYVTDFFGSFKLIMRPIGGSAEPVNIGERAHGIAHLLTGVWLMYLTFSTTLNISLGYHLPAG